MSISFDRKPAANKIYVTRSRTKLYEGGTPLGKRDKKLRSFRTVEELIPHTPLIPLTPLVVDKLRPERNALISYKLQISEIDKLLSGYKKKIRFREEPANKANVRPKVAGQVLDCKGLSNDRLKNYFSMYLPYCKNIYKNMEKSKRHEMFMKGEYSDNADYSRPMVSKVFLPAQILYLIELLSEAFADIGEFLYRLRYIMKVLVPELCLKIFMDYHNMTDFEASMYLDELPEVKGFNISQIAI